jgi:hypothetical protein
LFCLLEDEALITGFNVDTTRLLSPSDGAHDESEVDLLIDVSVKVIVLTMKNMGY